MNDTAKPAHKDYVSAREALQRLDIRLQTLYSYVSRGWIRSFKQPGRMDRLYLTEDIERVRARSQARAGHGAVAASAMQLGEPIIATSITEITPEGPCYLGRPSLELARARMSFEAVAELLWAGLWHDAPLCWDIVPIPAELRRLTGSIGPIATPDQLIEVFALITLTLGLIRGGVAERVRKGQSLEAARQIIQTLAGCFGYISAQRRFVPLKPGEHVSGGLLRALTAKPTEENREALEAILVLLADHELAPGAFAARVAASSGATLHGCLASAMCANSGVRVGRMYDQIEDFLAGTDNSAELLRRTGQAQRRGQTVPGFSHALYPKGDPRGTFLLDLARRRTRPSRRLAAVCSFADAAIAELGLHPRVELAVVALCMEMGLPARSGGAVFTLARSAGWVAHVLEQRLSASLLRPRAKFVAA